MTFRLILEIRTPDPCWRGDHDNQANRLVQRQMTFPERAGKVFRKTQVARSNL